MRFFFLINDNTAIMPTIVGSSGCENIAERDELWSPCFLHMLSTIMNHVTREVSDYGKCLFNRSVTNEFSAVKKVVACMKRTGQNFKFPLGYNLMQNKETTFGAVVEVFQMDLKSVKYLEERLDGPGHIECFSITKCKRVYGTVHCLSIEAGFA